MELLSLFPDKYLLQLNKFVFCSPLTADGKRGTISPCLQIAEELLGGVITWASLFHGVGDKSKHRHCIPLSHRDVGWCFLCAMGLQSLSCGLTAVYFSRICLAVVLLALGTDYYGERQDVGLWVGCVLWWGCGRSLRWWVNDCSPPSVLPCSWSGAPYSTARWTTAGWSWYIMRAESTILYQKLMKRREKVKAAMKIPFHICFFQCK